MINPPAPDCSASAAVWIHERGRLFSRDVEHRGLDPRHESGYAGVGAANLAASLALPTVSTTPSYNVADLESCSAGITECDALIAQTGSVLLTSRSGGGRALSVLPPHHIAIARRDQLVPDLPAAYAQLHATYGHRWPSLITFITGPSRTGDIERILVLGAHGPKKLTILVVP